MPKIPKETKLDVTSQVDDLDDEYKTSFRNSPTPVLIELKGGFQLYKWAGTSRVDPATGHRLRNTIFNARGFSSPYWAPWAAMDAYRVPGFVDMRKRYANMPGGVGRPQEFARARFAVSAEFSEMNSLIKCELRNPAWAFLGQCAPQPVSNSGSDPRKVLFIGGDYQLLVPGLQAEDIFQL